MKKLSSLWPVILIALSLLTGALAIGEVRGPGRVMVTLCFISLCPGMAIMRLIFRPEMIAQIMLAVALSFALDSVVAMSMLFTGHWRPEIGLAFLISLTLALAVFDLLRHTPLQQKREMMAKPNRKRHRHGKLREEVRW